MSITPTAGRHAPNSSGPLRHDRADQQSAVAAALDGQFVGPGVFVFDQPLGGGDEIVEDVLLLQFRAGLVPCLAIFAAAAQIRLGIDAAHLHPRHTADRKRRRQRRC